MCSTAAVGVPQRPVQLRISRGTKALLLLCFESAQQPLSLRVQQPYLQLPTTLIHAPPCHHFTQDPHQPAGRSAHA